MSATQAQALSERQTSRRRNSIEGYLAADSAVWPVWQHGDEQVARGRRAGIADGIDAAAQGKNCIFAAGQDVDGDGWKPIADDRGLKSLPTPGMK